MRRRHFLRTAAALPLATNLDHWANEKPAFKIAPGFSLKILNTNWGFAGTREAFFAKTKEAGYDGAELWVPGDEKDRNALQEQASAAGLEIGLLCAGSDADFSKHLTQFETNLRHAVGMKPLYVNCHSGKDWFSFEQNLQIIDLSIRISKESGVPVYHETHRGRMLFAAHISRRFMEQAAGLRLTLDISHWCNVHESLLGDQEETIALALSRTDHIHTRVGHPEGPQVNDPRAPEWESALQRHLGWWDKVVEMKAKAGLPLTMLTEFGPPTYLPALPYTRQPVADQWGINVYMKDMLRKRYAQ
ncbi:MAG: sugar phosphate isomerase/epimerase [Saprospiraceae bacterium]|nr:sugar phosphate isomerase/epimerase [Saprospiraceae bacterium]